MAIGNINTAAPLLVISWAKIDVSMKMTNSMACGPRSPQRFKMAAVMRSAAPVWFIASPMPSADAITMSTCQLMLPRAIVPVTQRVPTMASAQNSAAATGSINPLVKSTTSRPRIPRASQARSWRTGREPSTVETR